MDLLALIAEKKTLLLDGAMGTELMRRGFRPGGPPEEWNVTRPDDVAAIHRAYFAAGSDIVQTNTFGGSRLKLDAFGAGDRAAELNEAGARLAVALRDERVPRAPGGRRHERDGALRGADGRRRARASFATSSPSRRGRWWPAASTSSTSRPCSTWPRRPPPSEGARSPPADLPVIASLAYKPGPQGLPHDDGGRPGQAADAAARAGATTVGCNCEITADAMGELVDELREAAGRPVVAQPNAGQPRLQDGETVYDETPEHFAGLVARSPHGAPASSAAAAARRRRSSRPWPGT